MESRSNSKFFEVMKSYHFWLGLLVIVLATIINFISSDFIQKLFPDRQPIIDSLFKITPYIGWTQYLTDIAVLVAPATILYFIFKKDLRHLPFYLFAFGTAYFLRGIMIILNPIGGAFGNMERYGITPIMQHGMFPSGHTILVFCALFLSSQIASRLGRRLLIFLALVEVISLILSRGHYSIDIIGGILVSYLVVNEMKKRKSDFTL